MASDPDRDESENEQERVNRELSELLEEVRVALPGAEVLFAFLLGVAFTERFTDLTTVQEAVYFATLGCVAAGIALLVAPTAFHRINFREGGKEHLLYSATRMVLASLVLLLLAVTGVVYLVADLVYGSAAAAVAALVTAAWFVWFWFALPVLARRERPPVTGG
jgi:cation transport ATPase